MNKKYSFADLLTQSIVIEENGSEKEITINNLEIPRIQRDYAQGRKINDKLLSGSSFLTAIFDHLENDTEMEMDFIYGAVHLGKFEPLDGQQRLTTLFLLHWYFATREFEKDVFEEFAQKLKKFTYETRASSRMFCENLCERQLNISTQLPVDVITNAHWFYKSYHKDPTIQAMLNMIEQIDELYKKLDDSVSYFPRLSKLHFYILPLNNFKLTDELYVKMNARGKPLTHFENFKADLTKWMKAGDNPYCADYYAKVKYGESNTEIEHFSKISLELDNKWTDTIWNLEKDSDKKVDKRFIMLFKRYCLGKYLAYTDIEGKSLTSDPVYKYFNGKEDTYSVFTEFKSILDNPEENVLFSFERFFNQYSEHFQAISNDIQPNWRYWQEKKGGERMEYSIFSPKLTSKDRIVFFAIARYLELFDYNQKQFKEWMRIIWNITLNTDINDASALGRAIKLINELSIHADKIYSFLADENSVIVLHSSEKAIKEERIKASYICKDNSWETIFINAEKHPFFEGSINFLLTDNMKQEEFNHRFEMASFIFDDNGISPTYRRNGHILLRALISNYDSFEKLKNGNGKGRSFYTDKDEKEHYLKKMLVNDQYVIDALIRYCNQPSPDKIMEMLKNDIHRNSLIAEKAKKDGESKLAVRKKAFAHEALYKTETLQNWMQEESRQATRFQYSYYSLNVSRPMAHYDWVMLDPIRSDVCKFLIENGYETKQRLDDSDYFWGFDIELVNSKKKLTIEVKWEGSFEVYKDNQIINLLDGLNYIDNENIIEELKAKLA